MRVRCKIKTAADLPDEVLSRSPAKQSRYPLTIGRLYTVFALSLRGPDPMVFVINDNDRPMWYPLAGFEIADTRVSDSWSAVDLGRRSAGLTFGYESLTRDPDHHDALLLGSMSALRSFVTECDRSSVDAREAFALERLEAFAGGGSWLPPIAGTGAGEAGRQT